MNRLLFSALVLPLLLSLLGLHGRTSKRPRTRGSQGSNRRDSEKAEELLDQGDTNPADPPRDPPSKKKPKKPKPQFKASNDALAHAWNDHKPGSQYDKDGKHGNIWHDDMTEKRLNEMIAYTQNPDPGRVQVTPRNPSDPRGGHYYDYNTHDESNPTGRKGQTGIRVPVDGDGEMLTAMPYPHKDPDNPHGDPNDSNGRRRR